MAEEIELIRRWEGMRLRAQGGTDFSHEPKHFSTGEGNSHEKLAIFFPAPQLRGKGLSWTPVGLVKSIPCIFGLAWTLGPKASYVYKLKTFERRQYAVFCFSSSFPSLFKDPPNWVRKSLKWRKAGHVGDVLPSASPWVWGMGGRENLYSTVVA